MIIEFTLNGEKYKKNADPGKRLVDFLREDMGLIGTKEGCGEGECGACTVVLDGRAVHSCLVLAGQINGKRLLTVEGLARGGELSPLQKAFIEHGAIQCRYLRRIPLRPRTRCGWRSRATSAAAAITAR